MNMLFGIACGLIGGMSWGVVDSCATFAGRRIGILITAAGIQLTALVPLIALCLLTGTSIPTDPSLVAQAAIVGLIAGAGYLVIFQALRLGPVSVVSPIISSYGGLSVVFAGLFLGESLRLAQACGVAVSAMGVALAGVVLERSWRRSRPVGRGVPFAVLGLVIWAIVMVGLATPIRELGWLPTLLIARLAATVFLLFAGTVRLIAFPSAKRRQPLRLNRHAAALILAMGSLDVLGFAVWAIGLAATTAWLAGIAGSIGPIVTMTFGLVIFRERLRPNQWLGTAAVFTGIALVAAS